MSTHITPPEFADKLNKAFISVSNEIAEMAGLIGGFPLIVRDLMHKHLDAILIDLSKANMNTPTQPTVLPWHDHDTRNNQAPTAPGFYWVRPKGMKAARIAEVMPCDRLDKRPAGSLKLSFTQVNEALHLEGYEYAGPIPPPPASYDPHAAQQEDSEMRDVTGNSEFFQWFTKTWPEPKSKHQRSNWAYKRDMAHAGWVAAKAQHAETVRLLENVTNRLKFYFSCVPLEENEYRKTAEGAITFELFLAVEAHLASIQPATAEKGTP